MLKTASPGNGARFAAMPLVDGGTPVQKWLSADRLPLLDLDECTRLVVVAPHPDDETLGLGAMAAQLIAAGMGVQDLQVVSVSDGGAAVPGVSSGDRARLEATRRSEMLSATNILGIQNRVSLGLPDGQLAEHQERLLQQAAQCFRSQFEPPVPGAAPVLPPFVLTRLMAVGEVVFR